MRNVSETYEMNMDIWKSKRWYGDGPSNNPFNLPFPIFANFRGDGWIYAGWTDKRTVPGIKNGTYEDRKNDHLQVAEANKQIREIDEYEQWATFWYKDQSPPNNGVNGD